MPTTPPPSTKQRDQPRAESDEVLAQATAIFQSAWSHIQPRVESGPSRLPREIIWLGGASGAGQGDQHPVHPAGARHHRVLHGYSEFRYQSSLELDEETFDAVRHIPLARRMLVDVLNERGYRTTATVEMREVPTRVDPATYDIVLTHKPRYRFEVHFQGSQIRRGN